MRRLAALLIIACGLVPLSPSLHADDAKSAAAGGARSAQDPADDPGLLEFLGSIGSEDDAWISYLASTDPAKVASASPPPRRQPADAAKPAGETSAGSQER